MGSSPSTHLKLGEEQTSPLSCVHAPLHEHATPTPNIIDTPQHMFLKNTFSFAGDGGWNSEALC